MIDRIPSEEIDAAVRCASQELFSTMLQLPLEAGVFFDETSEPESLDGVVALVGIAGSWTGTGRIACSPHFACRLAGALLMQPFESVNEEVLDAVAEISNMIIGKVKTIFEETLGSLALSVPTPRGAEVDLEVPLPQRGQGLDRRAVLGPAGTNLALKFMSIDEPHVKVPKLRELGLLLVHARV